MAYDIGLVNIVLLMQITGWMSQVMVYHRVLRCLLCTVLTPHNIKPHLVRIPQPILDQPLWILWEPSLFLLKIVIFLWCNDHILHLYTE